MDITALVKNHKKLTTYFGEWPSFHDAEITDLHFWRGRLKPGDWDDENVMPVLTLKVLILNATQSSWPENQNRADSLATIRFHEVNDVRLENFNHGNQIIDLNLTIEERGTFMDGTRLPPYIVINFVSGFGLSLSFRCFEIEIIDAVPVDGSIY